MDIEQYDDSIKSFIKGHLHDDPFSLSLRYAGKQEESLELAIKQIRSRQKSKQKLPGWYDNLDLIFPEPVSVEQASSEMTAIFKSKMFSGHRMADLTGGMGVDTYYFAKQFRHIVYVDANKELCTIARHNFKVLATNNVKVVHSDARAFLENTNEKFDLIYLDPSRRSPDGKRVNKLVDGDPNVSDMLELLTIRSKKVLVKVSPWMDIMAIRQSIQYAARIFVISWRNECKEILVLVDPEHKSEVMIEAADLGGKTKSINFTMEEERNAKALCGPPGQYIYEPNAAILKSGAFKTICHRYDVLKLHPNTHLYTSDVLIDEFPGKKFQLEGVLSPQRKKVVGELHENRQANVVVRNYPESADQIKSGWRIKDGGFTFLFFTTLHDAQKVVLLCQKLK